MKSVLLVGYVALAVSSTAAVTMLALSGRSIHLLCQDAEAAIRSSEDTQAEFEAIGRVAEENTRRRASVLGRIILVSGSASVGAGDKVGLQLRSPSGKEWRVTPTGHPILVIDSPLDGAEVGASLMIEGHARGWFSGEVWVAVWPELAPGLGWPQSPNAFRGEPALLNREKGTWSSPVFLGGPPQTYEIVVYLASESASEAMRQAMRRWAAYGHYPGIAVAKLPDGVVEQQRIRVKKVAG
jgi:hypothetical protein